MQINNSISIAAKEPTETSMSKDQDKMENMNARPENDEERNDVTKQKAEEEKAKKRDIASHFQTACEKPRSASKQATKSTLKSSRTLENETCLKTLVNTTTKKIHSCLVLGTPLERDSIAGHKKDLGKLVDEKR